MTLRHLDLFSGIGGFALAVDEVWPGSTHIFCDNDPFVRQVLKQHWPESEIYDDIRDITDPPSEGLQGGARPSKGRQDTGLTSDLAKIDILTGGFPCQPFSAAGLRKGSDDDRHLWPEMLRVIRLTKPQWVIAENVGGILTWNEGLVFEQVCSDMEAAGYAVQPFVIPAVAVNAPHRRDRIWFIAYSTSRGWDTQPQPNSPIRSRKEDDYHGFKSSSWNKDWMEVAARLCSVDDGLPAEVGDFTLTKAGHRREQLKAYGNAIVPQVAVEIMRGIKCASV